MKRIREKKTTIPSEYLEESKGEAKGTKEELEGVEPGVEMELPKASRKKDRLDKQL